MLLATSEAKPVIRRLCTRAIVLEKGEIVFDGPLKPALRTLRELRSD